MLPLLRDKSEEVGQVLVVPNMGEIGVAPYRWKHEGKFAWEPLNIRRVGKEGWSIHLWGRVIFLIKLREKKKKKLNKISKQNKRKRHVN